MPNPPQFSHAIYWKRTIQGRKRQGDLCTILRERNGQAHIQFEDGCQAIISRRALRAASKVGEVNGQPS